MKVKSLFGILGTLVIVLFASCNHDEKTIVPKRTVVAGVVHNFTKNASNVLVVNYCDPLSDTYQFTQSLEETNGHFQTEHEYVFPQNLTIRFANKFLNIFVFPGDSLFVSIDANKMSSNIANAVEFSGKNAKLNKELFLWTTYSYSMFNSQFDESASPSDFIESVRQNFVIMKDSIEAYSRRNEMSDFMKRWALVDHKFIAANYIMDYNHPEANNWDIFTHPIFDIFNENNFQTMYFQYHLSTCMNALIEDDAEITQLFSDKEDARAIQLTIDKLFKKAPEGSVRDAMLFSFFQDRLTDMPHLYDSIPEIKTAFSQDIFGSMLESQISKQLKVDEYINISEKEKQLEGVVYLDATEIEELPRVQLLNYLSEKYRNKVLYLDVWATWCGPCLDAFKYTPNLHQYFRDKDVVFINLCLESQIEKWAVVVEKHNIGGEHYFLGNNAANLFRADNNLSGFPSYLIIDKQRRIVNPAPNPKDLESVIQGIESCLE